MPCYCPPPSVHEIESNKVRGFLEELSLPKSNKEWPESLHENTRTLCNFCKDADITLYSLELQIWWRDHQEADAKRLAEEATKAMEDRARESAKSKLTEYEKAVLGLS